MTYDELPPKCREKADVVRKAIEQEVTKQARQRACIRLQVCDRTLNRYINACRAGMFEVFVHGNTGRKPVTVIPKERREEIRKIYLEEFPDASFTHFCEILRDDYGINTSPSSLENILKHESFIVSPLANRSTVIKYSRKLKKLKAREKNGETDEIRDERAKYLLDAAEGGARKPRSQYMGELIEMDASSLEWVSGAGRWHLHLAVDDATGEAVGAWFDTQETLLGYYMVLKQIIENYGLPLTFRTDRRTCFEYSLRHDTPVSQAGRITKHAKQGIDDESPALTQFRAALERLGIDLQANSEPLFKPRAERLNHTFQMRLPVDLKRAGIKTIEEANAFLPSYLKRINGLFSHRTKKDDEVNVFVPGPSEKELNIILSVRVPRSMTGSTVKCDRKIWAIYDGDGKRILFRDRTPCTVIKALDGTMYCEAGGKNYLLRELAERRSSSPDPAEEKEAPSGKPDKKKPHVPAADHPWRTGGKK